MSSNNDDCGQFKPVKQLASIPLNVFIPEKAVNISDAQSLGKRADDGLISKDDYFEIQREDWSTEYLQNEKKETFPSFFENAFSKLSFKANDWVQEYSTGAGKQWINEYVDGNSVNQVDETQNWAQEFLDAANEEEELRETAKNILGQLKNDHDPKLARSRFMAYLKKLAGDELATPLKEEWVEQFSRLPLGTTVEDIKWASMEKTWNKLTPTGYGYKDFASHSFGTYYFSDISFLENDIHGIKHQILSLERQIRSEEMLNAQKWVELGSLQQVNEMDPQAIAAFLQALRLDSNNTEALLGLASSCYNENCIPDALSALRSLIEKSHRSDLASEDPDYLLMQINNLLSTGQKTLDLFMAASMVNGILKRTDEAARYMRDALAISPKDWRLKNKLAALLANSEKYDEALQFYEEIISSGVKSPRVFYNQGIAYLCTDRIDQAQKSLETALSLQLPANLSDGSSSVDPTLVPNYNAIAESLGLIQRFHTSD